LVLITCFAQKQDETEQILEKGGSTSPRVYILDKMGVVALDSYLRREVQS